MTSTTTRRQLLSLATSAAAYAGGAAIVGGGIALASEAHGETPAPESFASVWLRQWTENGGTVLDSYDGLFAFGWPEYYLSDAHTADHAKIEAGAYYQSLDERTRATADRQTDAWNDAHYVGTMRTLLAVVKAVPGAVDEVKAIVTENPRRGWTARMRGEQA